MDTVDYNEVFLPGSELNLFAYPAVAFALLIVFLLLAGAVISMIGSRGKELKLDEGTASKSKKLTVAAYVLSVLLVISVSGGAWFAYSNYQHRQEVFDARLAAWESSAAAQNACNANMVKAVGISELVVPDGQEDNEKAVATVAKLQEDAVAAAWLRVDFSSLYSQGDLYEDDNGKSVSMLSWAENQVFATDAMFGLAHYYEGGLVSGDLWQPEIYAFDNSFTTVKPLRSAFNCYEAGYLSDYPEIEDIIAKQGMVDPWK